MSEVFKRIAQVGTIFHRAAEIHSDVVAQGSKENDPYGEIAAAAIIEKASDVLQPYLGERPNGFLSNVTRNSQYHNIYPHDYISAALASGTIEEKRGRRYFRNQLFSGALVARRAQMEAAYAERAHIVYEAGRAGIDYGAFLTDKPWQQVAWQKHARELGWLSASSNDTGIIHTMPHIGNIVYRTLQFTSRQIMGPSPVRAALKLYGTQTQEIGQQYTSDNIHYVSDRIGHECIELSNTLLESDHTMYRSGLPFIYLEDKPHLASRAISQVMMLSVLKAVEARDMEAVAFLSNVAYATWAMTRLDSLHRSDVGMTSDLAWAWKIASEDDWDLDPGRLHTDPQYTNETFAALVTRAPHLQRLLD